MSPPASWKCPDGLRQFRPGRRGAIFVPAAWRVRNYGPTASLSVAGYPEPGRARATVHSAPNSPEIGPLADLDSEQSRPQSRHGLSEASGINDGAANAKQNPEKAVGSRAFVAVTDGAPTILGSPASPRCVSRFRLCVEAREPGTNARGSRGGPCRVLECRANSLATCRARRDRRPGCYPERSRGFTRFLQTQGLCSSLRLPRARLVWTCSRCSSLSSGVFV